MKGYLKYFRVYFIIILVLTVIFAALKLTGAGKQPAERGNTEAGTQERVFEADCQKRGADRLRYCTGDAE